MCMRKLKEFELLKTNDEREILIKNFSKKEIKNENF